MVMRIWVKKRERDSEREERERERREERDKGEREKRERERCPWQKETVVFPGGSGILSWARRTSRATDQANLIPVKTIRREGKSCPPQTCLSLAFSPTYSWSETPNWLFASFADAQAKNFFLPRFQHIYVFICLYGFIFLFSIVCLHLFLFATINFLFLFYKNVLLRVYSVLSCTKYEFQKCLNWQIAFGEA